MKMFVVMVVVALALASCIQHINAQPFWPHYPNRTITVLDTQWEFGFRSDIADAIAATPQDAKYTGTVSVPNAFDVAQPGMLGRRGTAFYRIQLNITANTRGAIQLCACAFYCKVFMNNQLLGEHRAGGYQPFWVYYPSMPAKTATLVVVADNRFNSTTAPTTTGGDFYFYGGITRQVIVHELPFNTYSIERAETFPIDLHGHINVRVVLHQTYSGPITLLLGFDNHPNPTHIDCVAANGIIDLPNVAVPNARLWSFEAPNLHTVQITVPSGDMISVRFGLRIIASDARGRLVLNGKVIQLRGVNRHTMWPDTGSAVTLAQIQTDIELFKELGINFVRGAHYPQDQRYLDLLDEAGIGLWEETLGPNVKITDLTSTYFMQYQLQAVHEMISASINHPCIFIYAFYNEGPSNNPLACPGYEASATAIRNRVGTPPTRLVSWASCMLSNDKCLALADVVSFNAYPAWYISRGNLSAIEPFWSSTTSWAREHYPTKPFIMSETGAGGVYEWTNSSDPFWSQQFQNEVVYHDAHFAVTNKNVSGITIWQFSDIKADDEDTTVCGPCVYEPHPPTLSVPWTCAYVNVSCGRPAGENHKGMVDFWRRKKLVFNTLRDLYKYPPPN